MQQLTITNETENQRLDKFLLKYLNSATKSFVYKMLRKKNIKLNNKKCVGNEILNDGDIITLYIRDVVLDKFMSEKIVKHAKPIDIIFEDENIIIMNKPAGLLSHDDIDTDSLNHRMLYYLEQTGQFDTSKQSTFTPSICNRLDMNTSGIITGAKNLKASVALNAMFKNNEIDRFYLALVKGSFKVPTTIQTRFVRDNNISKISYNENDRQIITIVNPVKCFKEFSLVSAKLMTGKPHQIRLHLGNVGYYVIGDPKYGAPDLNARFRNKYKLKNQFLHCNKIVFKNKDCYLGYLYDKAFECNLPNDLEKILQDLKI